jgi:hypothetical protein
MRTPVVANDIQVAHSELERRVPERAASLEQRHSELRSDVEKRLKLEEHMSGLPITWRRKRSRESLGEKIRFYPTPNLQCFELEPPN